MVWVKIGTVESLKLYPIPLWTILFILLDLTTSVAAVILTMATRGRCLSQETQPWVVISCFHSHPVCFFLMRTVWKGKRTSPHFSNKNRAGLGQMKPRNRSLYYTFRTNFAFYHVRRCPLPSVGSRKQKNFPPYESAGSVETTKE